MYLIDEKLYKKKILNGDPALNVNNDKQISNSILESYPRTEFVRREYDIASTAGLGGETGIVGPPGQQGPVGPAGAQGIEGAVGPSGPPGVEGRAGPPGSSGPEGAVGQTGPPGALGPEGAAGPPGPPAPARTAAIDMTPGSVAMDITTPVGLVSPHQESTPNEDDEEMDCAHCQLSDTEPTSIVSDQSSKRKINDERGASSQKQIKYTAAPNQEHDSVSSDNADLGNEEWLEMKEWLRKMRTDIDFPPRRYTHGDISKSQKIKRRTHLSGKQTKATHTSNENEKNYDCLICHLNFKKRSSLVKHVQRSHSEYFEKGRGGNKRKYETETSNAYNFKKQKSGEKTEGTEFKNRNSASSTKKAPPKKVMFICTYCLKKFQSKMLLKRHILIFHPTKKNIKPNLPAHISTPQAERGKVSYFCSICETRFSREKSLSNHVRRAHKEYFEQWERDFKRKRSSEPEGVYVKRQKNEHKLPIHYQDYF